MMKNNLKTQLEGFDIRLYDKDKHKKCLNLGCGRRCVPGWDNVDKYACDECPDILQMDLFTAPWPFKDNTFDFAYANHFFEHIPRGKAWWTILNELVRVLKDGSIIEIRGPYPRAKSLIDADHRRLVDVGTFKSAMRRKTNGLGITNFTAKGRLEHIYRKAEGQYHFQKYLGVSFPPFWGIHLAFRVRKEQGKEN